METTIVETAIAAVKIVEINGFHDHRGGFWTLFERSQWAAAELDFSIHQVSRVESHQRATIRGLHYQTPPFAQAKVVMATAGIIYDVAVDLRPGSESFGRHVATTLSAEAPRALFVPRGFAHGYCTLTRNTEVVYFVDNRYAPDHEAGVYWADPDLDITWPVGIGEVHLSERDRHLPALHAKDRPAAE